MPPLPKLLSFWVCCLVSEVSRHPVWGSACSEHITTFSYHYESHFIFHWGLRCRYGAKDLSFTLCMMDNYKMAHAEILSERVTFHVMPKGGFLKLFLWATGKKRVFFLNSFSDKLKREKEQKKSSMIWEQGQGAEIRESNGGFDNWARLRNIWLFDYTVFKRHIRNRHHDSQEIMSCKWTF